jgi:hypothetical protein
MRLPNTATAALALLALTLGWSRTATASAARAELSEFVSRDDVAQLQALASTLAGKRGHKLANHLDDIAVSPKYNQIMSQVSFQLSQSHGGRGWPFADANNDVFLEAITSLRPLAARTAAAIAAITELYSKSIYGDVVVETDRMLEADEQLADVSSDRTVPARLRQELRLALRGGVALGCLPLLVNADESLRREMFRHAAIGMESNVRLLAAHSDDRAHAAELLKDLGLEPFDLDAVSRREQDLEVARASVTEARQYIPKFGMPLELED